MQQKTCSLRPLDITCHSSISVSRGARWRPSFPILLMVVLITHWFTGRWFTSGTTPESGTQLAHNIAEKPSKTVVFN